MPVLGLSKWPARFTGACPFPLRLVRGNLLEQLKPARIDLSRCDRVAYRAAGFVGVVAVVEAALAEILRELDETLFYAAEAQVMQAEGLHAGTVDQ